MTNTKRPKLHLNKLCLLGILMLLSFPKVFGQTLGQDADGFSSLVLPSSVINLDLANEIASFSYYDYLGSKNDFLVGGEIKGRSENGISNLFNDGELIASASMSGLFGVHLWGNHKPDLVAKAERNRIDLELDKLDRKDDILVWEIDAFLNEALEIKSLTETDYDELYKAVHGRLPADELNKLKSKLKDNRNKLSEKLEQDDIKKDEKEKILARMINQSAIIDRLISMISIRRETKELKKKYDKVKDTTATVQFRNALAFLRLSADGASYREDAGNGAQTLDNRFPKRTFNGFRGEFGFNYNAGDHYFGLSLAGNYTNNLSELDATSFTLIVDDNTTNPGLLRTTQSIEAFGVGTVDTFQRYDINLDAAFLIAINSSEDLKLSINPYGRFYHYNNSNFEDRLDFGLGIFALNAAKGQLLGGALIQYNDVFGANDRPEDDFSSFDRVSFGLIVRFAFSGFDLETAKK